MIDGSETDSSGTEFTKRAGGAFADGLTLIRLLLTPIVMTVIIMGGWPGTQIAAFASLLFVIAALTDIFDDMVGGAEGARYRKYGWFDDIADTVLVTGTLATLLYVIFKADILGPLFAIPAGIIIIREITVGLIRGRSLIKNGWPETKWGTLKNGITMLAICLLLASPWITPWYDGLRAGENIFEIYDNPSTHIWTAGQILLWIAAILSTLTGLQIISGRTGAANDA